MPSLVGATQEMNDIGPDTKALRYNSDEPVGLAGDLSERIPDLYSDGDFIGASPPEWENRNPRNSQQIEPVRISVEQTTDMSQTQVSTSGDSKAKKKKVNEVDAPHKRVLRPQTA